MLHNESRKKQKTHHGRSSKASSNASPTSANVGLPNARSNGDLSNSRANKSSSLQSLSSKSGSIRSSSEKINETPKNMRSPPVGTNGSSQGPFSRQMSVDKVKNIVKREGRAARNLVTWSVPMQVKPGRKDSPRTGAKPDSRKYRGRATSAGSDRRDTSGDGRSTSNPPTPRRTDMRARYWAFLFDNLHRAVDEIYKTCEADESAVECREVIMMLEQCTNDFKSLIQKMHVLKQFENVEPSSRPHSVAWEVRKISPSKPPLRAERIESPRNPRKLELEEERTQPAAGQETAPPGSSWADRVKGVGRQRSGGDVTHPVVPPLEGIGASEGEAEEGEVGEWETVGRGGKQKRSSPAVASAKSVAPRPARPAHFRRSTPLRAAPRASSPMQAEQAAWPRPPEADDSISVPVEEGDSPESASFPPADLDDPPKDDSMLDDELENAYDSVLESVLHAEDNLALKLAEEEASLAREIEQEENAPIIAEPETETETESELGNTMGSSMSSQLLDAEKRREQYAEQVTQTCAEIQGGKLWSDVVDEEIEGRPPGWRVKMNEKLSSPSRKRSTAQSEEETRRRMEQKQEKAERKRDQLLREKAERLRELTAKVEEVRMMKEDIQSQYSRTMSERLRRADRKRHVEIQKKVRKAQEEDAKVNEIAFISRLEQENRRHDILLKLSENESRLTEIQEDRQRRQDERAAKGAAVETRRKTLDAERRARLEAMQERRRLHQNRREQALAERERDRQKAARARDREREQRLASIEADKLAKKEELQRKIVHKTTEASRRKQEILQQTREKAFEMSLLRHSTEEPSDLPQLTLYEQEKLCTACNVLIPTEVYLLGHLRGKKHQKVLEEQAGGKKLAKNEIEQFNLKHIVDAPRERSLSRSNETKERIKAMKRRCKKLRQRMQSRGAEYETALSAKKDSSVSSLRPKFLRLLKDVERAVSQSGSGPWQQSRVSQLERSLGELQRLLANAGAGDQTSFTACGGVTTLCKLLMVIDASTDKLPLVVPAKSLILACNIVRLACLNNADCCRYTLLSNKMMLLADLLQHQLNLMIPSDMDHILSQSSGIIRLPEDPLATALARLLTALLNGLSGAVSSRQEPTEPLLSRGQDVVSYLVAIGVVDRLAQYFSNVRERITDSTAVADFLDQSLQLLTAATSLTAVIREAGSKGGAARAEDDCAAADDPTQLLNTFSCTEFVGLVPLLYGALVGQKGEQSGLAEKTQQVALAGVSFLNTLPKFSRSLLQSVLGSEGAALQFRHICSYVLNQCLPESGEEAVLHAFIVCMGHFALDNHDNQLLLQTGPAPTVLQRLGMLPFRYFSAGAPRDVLLPTLLACCLRCDANTALLQNEFSMRLLCSYIEENMRSEDELGGAIGHLPTCGRSATALATRFPRSLWQPAIDYFSQLQTATQ